MPIKASRARATEVSFRLRKARMEAISFQPSAYVLRDKTRKDVRVTRARMPVPPQKCVSGGAGVLARAIWQLFFNPPWSGQASVLSPMPVLGCDGGCK